MRTPRGNVSDSFHVTLPQDRQGGRARAGIPGSVSRTGRHPRTGAVSGGKGGMRMELYWLTAEAAELLGDSVDQAQNSGT